MSNELKCPFCQQELDYDDLLCSCINEKCEESFDMVGTELLWQKVINLQDDLIDTKKELELSEICCTEWEKQALDYKAESIGLQSKLDVAVKRLEDIVLDAEMLATPEYIASRAKETLAEITALEQKDVK